MSEGNRVTNNIQRYQDKRATALDLMEHVHDKAAETRLRDRHGSCATGYKAFLVRRTLSQFAIREADRNTINERTH